MRNKVQLIGNVGNEIKLKQFDSGKVNATFSLATNEKYVNSKGETIEDTQWHNIVAWGKLAKHLEQYITTGDEIGIEARLTYRSYNDNNDKKVSVTEILANAVTFFNVKKTKKP